MSYNRLCSRCGSDDRVQSVYFWDTDSAAPLCWPCFEPIWDFRLYGSQGKPEPESKTLVPTRAAQNTQQGALTDF